MAEGLSAGKVSMKVEPDTSKFGEHLKKGVEGHESFFGEYGKKIGETLLAGFAVLGIGDKIAEYIKGGVEEYEAFDRMNAQFAAGIKSTGNAAHLSVKDMDELAESIAEYSGQSVESIGKTEQVLQTFTNIKNVGPNKIFDDATKAAANMAAKLGGDASASAIQLGKALNDPVKGMTALRRVGVSFTDAQQDQVKAMVKAGDTMGAQKVILHELNTEFGGAAKAAGETFPGQIARAKVAVGAMEKEAVTPFMKALPGLIDGVIEGVEKATPVIGKVSEKIAEEVLPRIKAIHETIVKAFDSNAGNFSGLGSSIVALVKAFFPLVTVVESLKGTLPSLAQLLKAVVPLLTTIVKAITPIVQGFSDWLEAISKTATGSAVLKTLFVTVAAGVAAFKAITIATQAWATVTKIAAAAQVVLDAALNANPISIIIIAVAALVAGLVYFFTQTKVGQQVWANFTRFLGEAWANVVSVVTTVWNAIVAAFNAGVAFVRGLIQVVVTFIQQHWQLLVGIFLGPIGLVVALVISHFTQIKAFITTAINNVMNVIKTVLNAIKTAWNLEWTGIRIVVTTVWNAIKSFVTTAINGVKSVITNVVNAIKTAWNLEWTGIRIVVTTVWNAIKSFVTSAIASVKGVIDAGVSTIKGVWNAGWNAIKSFMSSVWSAIVSAVSNAIGKVVSFFSGLAGKIKGAIGNAATMLTTIGSNIIQGLINGIQAAAGRIGSVVQSIINGIPAAVRKLLGIHSPSTVFAEIGKFVGEGLIVGLKGTSDDIADTMGDLTSKVTDAFSKLADNREAVQKRLKTLDRQLSQVHGNKQAQQDRRKNIEAEIADQKSLLAAMKNPKLKGTITDALKQDTADLGRLAVKRDALATNLKDITDKIADAVKARDDFAASTSSEAFGVGNIVNAYTTAMQALQSADENTPTVNPLDALIGNLRDSVAKTDQFNALLAQLKAQGLDDASYQQLVGAGVDSGLATAQAIEAGGPGAVQQISVLQGQLQVASQRLGTSTSATLYQGSIDAMQAQANGYTSQIAVVTGAIGVVEQSMAATLKQLGIDTSALSKQAGQDIGEGLKQGLQAKQGALEDVMSKLGKSLVKAIKKELKIKSPSRVMHELGGFTSEGFANGIASNTSKVQSAMTDVLKVPATSLASLKVPEAQAGAAPIVVQQTFSGQMGFTEEQVGDRIATRTRRGLQRVPLSRVPS